MSSSSKEIAVGYKTSVEVKVTDKMVHQFGEMCGDFNPIHFNEEYAKTTRFKRRIAHGMIVGALFSRALNDSLGEGGVYLAQSMKFVNPVFIDDILTIELTVTGLRKEKGIATVETLAKRKENGDLCVKGDAVIMVAGSPTDPAT
jgi:3-hydroxybutyryl-CoA dehydratase